MARRLLLAFPFLVLVIVIMIVAVGKSISSVTHLQGSGQDLSTALQGIDMSESKSYFEDIKEVKPGGHFLIQPNTIAACRSREFMIPSLCDRNTFEEWVELGRSDIYDRARERVEEILALPRKNTLPDDVVGKLEDIMKRADEDLKES